MKHISCLRMETYRTWNKWIVFNNVLKISISWPGLWFTYCYIFFLLLSVYIFSARDVRKNTQVKSRDKSIIIHSSLCVLKLMFLYAGQIFPKSLVPHWRLRRPGMWRLVGLLSNAELERMCEKYSRGIIWDTIAEFAWWDQEIPRKPSISLASHRDKIWNRTSQMRN